MNKPETHPPIIEVKDISFGYGKENVLEDISFHVHKGDYIGIIGPNGGGKSTMLKLILGLVPLQKGTIRIFGENISRLKTKSLIGYVPQRATQTDFAFPATVEEVIISGRTARIGWFGRFHQADRDAVEHAMEIADVKKYRTRMIQDLSGGERQRVFIARALSTEPKILILDEPTSGVDVSSQEKFYNFLTKLNRDLGMTILFVSHDIDAVANQVQSVLCLNKKLVCHGPPRDYIKEDFLQELYGKDVKLVMHGSAEHTHSL